MVVRSNKNVNDRAVDAVQLAGNTILPRLQPLSASKIWCWEVISSFRSVTGTFVLDSTTSGIDSWGRLGQISSPPAWVRPVTGPRWYIRPVKLFLWSNAPRGLPSLSVITRHYCISAIPNG